MRRCIAILVAFCPFLWSTWLQAAPTAPAKALSTRVVEYRIEARYNPIDHTLDATEVLTYHNLTGQPLDTFPFHLYLNGFQPASTAAREIRRDDPSFEYEPKYRGAIDIKSLEAQGQNLTAQLKFIQPDDSNSADKTVVEVKLPHPVAPGSDVQFKIVFRDSFPEIFARTGYHDDFIMGAQWFPKVGVWWHGAWNCHQFHATTEFFADFGVYHVKLTLPQNYVVGSSGDEIGSASNNDGTKTVSLHGEDIHDFAWAASPRYRVIEKMWQGSGGPVKMRLLVAPEHMNQAARYQRSLEGALARFDQWYGAYPYDRITLIDPPAGAYRASGMEYPTLFTGLSTWWMPPGFLFPEDETVHEFGHQYWYGMVATNEFEEAWLDEGINTYSEIKVMESLYKREVDISGLTGTTAGERHWSFTGYTDTDALGRASYRTMSEGSYGAVSYGKTACMLLTLESLIGEDTVRRALRTYFERYKFTHPTGEDFLKTVEEVSGQNLRWFFDQAVYGTQVLDYEVAQVRSERPDWWNESGVGDKKAEWSYHSTVLVRRRGDFVFPVELEVRFDDGTRVREHWDGKDRWVRFEYDKKAKLVSAEVDPDHKVWLDRDFYNNSRTLEPNTGARRKLTGYWMLITQFLAQALAWWV